MGAFLSQFVLAIALAATPASGRGHTLTIETRVAGTLVTSEVSVTEDGPSRRVAAPGGRAVVRVRGHGPTGVSACTRDMCSDRFDVVWTKPAQSVVLSLRPSARLHAEVLDGDDRPRPGLKLELQGVGNRRTWAHAETNAEGKATLGPVPVAAYQLSVGRQESLGWFELARSEVSMRFGGKGPEPFVLRGNVVSATGAPAGEVDLHASRPNGVGAYPDRTNADGGFELAVLEPGLWLLWVSPGPGGSARRETQPGTPVVLQLDRRAGLELRTVDQGKPAALTSFSMAREGASQFIDPDNFASAGTTDARGRAELWGFPAGRFVVRLGAVGSTDPERDTRATEATVSLVEGKLTQLEVQVDHGAMISGVVRGLDGGPADSMNVFAFSADGGGRSASTQEQGAFLITLLEPNERYVLRAVPWQGRSAKETAQASAPVEARAPARGVTLQMKPAPWLSGRVVDTRGRAIPAFAVNGQQVSARDGRFAIAVIPGSDAWLEADGFHAQRVVNPIDGNGNAGTLVVHPVVTIRGRVVGAHGEPVPGAEVRCHNTRGVMSGADGRFELPACSDQPTHPVTALGRGVMTEANWTGDGDLELQLSRPDGGG